MTEDRFKLRGFGTLGATTHGTDDVEFRRTTGQAHGVQSGEVDFGVDSIAGVQVDLRLASNLEMVVQGVSRMRADGDWKLHLSQGFLRYSPDESLVVRVGRVGYDIYLLAESRQVGYSYLPVRPSPEFYGQITNDDIDGGDVAYTRRLGRGLFRARVFGGEGSGELAFADETHRGASGAVYGATFDYIFRGWTARAAIVSFNYDAGPEIPLLVAALRTTGFPSAVPVANDLDDDVYTSQGMQLGVAFDDGPVQAQLMYGSATSDSISGPDFDKFYVLAGYRLQRWTPFASFARSRDRQPVIDAGLPAIPMLEPLNAAVRGIQDATRSTQRTSSVGVRYDLSSHIDFKFQVDRTEVRDSALMFDYRNPAAGPFDMTVVTAALDFVF